MIEISVKLISQIGLNRLKIGLPINDSLPVQKFQTRDDFSAVELCPLLGESSALLDVKH
jgi:hypothetical protein